MYNATKKPISIALAKGVFTYLIGLAMTILHLAYPPDWNHGEDLQLSAYRMYRRVQVCHEVALVLHPCFRDRYPMTEGSTLVSLGHFGITREH